MPTDTLTGAQTGTFTARSSVSIPRHMRLDVLCLVYPSAVTLGMPNGQSVETTLFDAGTVLQLEGESWSSFGLAVPTAGVLWALVPTGSAPTWRSFSPPRTTTAPSPPLSTDLVCEQGFAGLGDVTGPNPLAPGDVVRYHFGTPSSNTGAPNIEIQDSFGTPYASALSVAGEGNSKSGRFVVPNSWPTGSKPVVSPFGVSATAVMSATVLADHYS